MSEVLNDMPEPSLAYRFYSSVVCRRGFVQYSAHHKDAPEGSESCLENYGGRVLCGLGHSQTSFHRLGLIMSYFEGCRQDAEPLNLGVGVPKKLSLLMYVQLLFSCLYSRRKGWYLNNPTCSYIGVKSPLLFLFWLDSVSYLQKILRSRFHILQRVAISQSYKVSIA